MSYQQYPGQGYGYGVPMREPRGTEDPNDLSLPLYGASFMQAAKRFFQNYVKFTGRASRSEYWWTALMLAIIMLIPVALFIIGLVFMITTSVTAPTAYGEYGDSAQMGAMAGSAGLGLAIYVIGLILMIVISLGTLIPSIAITWRRLHDANLAGPFYFLSFIPYAGGIILIILACLPSKVEGERFDQVPGQMPQGYAPQGGVPYGYAQPGYQQSPYQQQAQYGQNQYGQQYGQAQNEYGQNTHGQYGATPNGSQQYQPPGGQQPQPYQDGQSYSDGQNYGQGNTAPEDPQDGQRN